MPKFRKKPVVVDAEQWHKRGDNPHVEPAYRVCGIPHVDEHLVDKCSQCGHLMQDHGKIKTLEGHHIVCPGDWIITGVKGERYPCKPDIFEETYERVAE